MKFVLIESPFAGDEEKNKEYAMKAMRDSLLRGEAPFASHLLYTQMLDDNDPIERSIGIEAGLEIGRYAQKTVVYVDNGISSGMKYGIFSATENGRDIEYRSLRECLNCKKQLTPVYDTVAKEFTGHLFRCDNCMDDGKLLSIG